MYSCEVTLEQILSARDKRAEKQIRLIKKYNVPLVTFTVNMPGNIKKSDISARVFLEGYRTLIKTISDHRTDFIYRETHDPVTGPEAYVLVDLDEKKLKELMIGIEEKHPMGRLFDLDVTGRDGFSVNREMLGFSSRKCLICDQPAHACARSKSHTLNELSEKIISLIAVPAVN